VFKTWSVILREENTFTVFENRVLRRASETRREEVTRDWRKFTMRSFEICNVYQILLGFYQER
jgi:hypothetical protein